MIRSFPDSGVLIDAARSERATRTKTALDYLDDRTRIYLTSPLIRLETIPKAHYMARSGELGFYENFFSHQEVQWCREWDRMERIADQEARKHGLNALDALHIAAAHLLNADELVTTEREHKPMYRTDLVRVVYLYCQP